MKKIKNVFEFDNNRFNIAILHHDIEPAEIKFKELFLNRGCNVSLFDIRSVSEKELKNFDFVFNRVYSSVASRDYEMLSKTLKLLKKLDKIGIICANSHIASKADYSKYDLYKLLVKNNISTPKTFFVKTDKEISTVSKKALSKLSFPIVVKRNCGGKSYEVKRVYSEKELLSSLREMFDLAKKQNYLGGLLIQEFVPSIRDHDCRVAISNNNFLYSYARTFISRDSEDKWLASTSGGSYEVNYNSTFEEISLAKRANKAINCLFSESDVIMTKNGPCIIEINPSAGYFVESEDDLNRMEVIVQSFLNLLDSQNNFMNVSKASSKVKIIQEELEEINPIVNSQLIIREEN